MNDYKIGVMETHFAELIWREEPISSMKLASLANQELGWKKSTSFTVLRHLCEKGLFQNNASVVTSLISKEEYEGLQSEQVIEERFHGSLPAFIAAFTARRSLSQAEIETLKGLIAAYEETSYEKSSLNS